MKIPFEKYHGAGNDFILIDNRRQILSADQKMIAQWCNRRLGIGADGLILLQQHPDFDFEMMYYNADGNIGSMCGNGGRCAVIFAQQLGIIGQDARFMAFDGVHTARVKNDESVSISMMPVREISEKDHAFVIDTGSPHYIMFVSSLKDIDVVTEGRKIRNSETFQKEGINVNFVELLRDEIMIRTYERGVEDETLSCGTGTVAAAVASSLRLNQNETEQLWNVHSLGGDLKVHFKKEGPTHFAGVFLEGPVTHVFRGSIDL